ncbi:hypothetical protein KM043_000203 [Ampulex compressa]|nr:hypothetical protein KM043_000203 [Ampulex compressa]
MLQPVPHLPDFPPSDGRAFENGPIPEARPPRPQPAVRLPGSKARSYLGGFQRKTFHHSAHPSRRAPVILSPLLRPRRGGSRPLLLSARKGRYPFLAAEERITTARQSGRCVARGRRKQDTADGKQLSARLAPLEEAEEEEEEEEEEGKGEGRESCPRARSARYASAAADIGEGP